MEADMNSIQIGHRGMQDMLVAIFGKGEREPGPAQQPIQVRQQPTSRPPGSAVPPAVKAAQTIANVSVKDLPKLTPSAFDRMFADHYDHQKGKP